MVEYYTIPKEIKINFTKEFMNDFLNELVDVFHIMHPVSYSNDLIYIECTIGWDNAFEKVCEKYKYYDALDYYKNLKWYDSDTFDGELSSLMVEYELVIK